MSPPCRAFSKQFLRVLRVKTGKLKEKWISEMEYTISLESANQRVVQELELQQERKCWESNLLLAKFWIFCKIFTSNKKIFFKSIFFLTIFFSSPPQYHPRFVVISTNKSVKQQCRSPEVVNCYSNVAYFFIETKDRTGEPWPFWPLSGGSVSSEHWVTQCSQSWLNTDITLSSFLKNTDAWILPPQRFWFIIGLSCSMAQGIF